MSVTLNFDATNVPQSSPMEPLPSGWYTCAIVDSSLEENSRRTGYFLKLTLQVLDGEFARRKVYDRLNIQNPNEVAVQIAQETLSAICHATGVMRVGQSSDLHNIPLDVMVALVDRSDGKGKANDVKGYRAAAPQQAAPAPAFAPKQAPVPQQQAPAPQQAAPAFAPPPAPQQAAPAPAPAPTGTQSATPPWAT